MKLSWENVCQCYMVMRLSHGYIRAGCVLVCMYYIASTSVSAFCVRKRLHVQRRFQVECAHAMCTCQIIKTCSPRQIIATHLRSKYYLGIDMNCEDLYNWLYAFSQMISLACVHRSCERIFLDSIRLAAHANM